MKIKHFIIIFLSILSSQDHIEELIQHVLHGSKDSAAISLPTIEQEYPNNPSAMYLKGLLETDGEKAKRIFSKLYCHPLIQLPLSQDIADSNNFLCILPIQ